MGAKFEANPKSFVIENGRLHVFYKTLLKSTRKSWLEEGGDRLRPAADETWKGFLAESDEER